MVPEGSSSSRPPRFASNRSPGWTHAGGRTAAALRPASPRTGLFSGFGGCSSSGRVWFIFLETCENKEFVLWLCMSHGGGQTRVVRVKKTSLQGKKSRSVTFTAVCVWKAQENRTWNEFWTSSKNIHKHTHTHRDGNRSDYTRHSM